MPMCNLRLVIPTSLLLIMLCRVSILRETGLIRISGEEGLGSSCYLKVCADGKNEVLFSRETAQNGLFCILCILLVRKVTFNLKSYEWLS